jgi:hypothetical protein
MRKSHLEIKKLICTAFHFLALYFDKIALLLANQSLEIFSYILLEDK